MTFWVCRLLLSCFLFPSVVLSFHKVRGRAPEKKSSSGFEDCGVWWLTLVEASRACWGSKPGERLCCECWGDKTEVFPVGGLRWSMVPPSPGTGCWRRFAWAMSGASTRICCCPASLSTTKRAIHMLRGLQMTLQVNKGWGRSLRKTGSFMRHKRRQLHCFFLHLLPCWTALFN